MNVLVFMVLVWSISFVAGFFGSLTGLGGGAVIVPALVLLFGVDIRYAIGASLVSIIATSSGAASAYVKEGFTNIRVGMLLEIATTFGALVGAGLATRVSTQAIAMVFGAFLIYSAVQSFLLVYAGPSTPLPRDPLATRLKLNGEYPAAGTSRQYNVQNVPAGFAMMFGAGTLSGLLGVGSGPLKVIAMDRAMKLPFKVSTTTSNFMIGVTAAASAGVYLSRGYIQPVVTLPVMIGVLIGAFLGSKALIRAQVALLRKIFAGVIFLIAIEMIYNGLTGEAVTRHTVRVEVVVSLVLRIGVLLALIIVLAGGAMYLRQHYRDFASFQHFNGEDSDLRSLESIWVSALRMRSDALIQLGLVVLIATPITRVLMSAIGFAIDGDRLYFAVSAVVFGVLMYGLSHAI